MLTTLHIKTLDLIGKQPVNIDTAVFQEYKHLLFHE